MEMRIVFNKVGAYTPGETVEGRVVLVKSGISLLPKPFGLHIQFDGKACVKFTLADRWGYKGRWRTHAASENYFHSSSYLIGDGQREVPELSGGGVAEFPFAYTLPQSLPSSYKGSHGSVEYTVTVTLKRSWGVNKEIVQQFHVNSHFDVTSAHHHQRRGEMGSAGSIRKSERVGMLWWGGTVFVHLNLRKKAYVPGECIQFNAQIINDSKSNLHKAKLLLTQEVRFIAQGDSHVVTHILKKVKGPGLRGGDRRITWEDPTILKIPPLPPTTLGGENICSLIEVNYFIHLLVQPSSLAFKDNTVLCKLPIIIGTKRGSSSRDSWCYGEGNNRVGSIFGTLDRMTASPTSTINTAGTGDWSYYQNVIFPLNRCFSAPIYENHRFDHRMSGHISPFSISEDLLEEGVELPPPSYEQATNYQNHLMTRALPLPPPLPTPTATPTPPSSASTVTINSVCASPIQQPLYNNE